MGEGRGGTTGGRQAKPKLNKKDFHPPLMRLCESIDSVHACLCEDDSNSAEEILIGSLSMAYNQIAGLVGFGRTPRLGKDSNDEDENSKEECEKSEQSHLSVAT